MIKDGWKITTVLLSTLDKIKIIHDFVGVTIVIYENDVEVIGWAMNYDIKVIEYFKKHYGDLGYTIELHEYRK